MKLSELLNAGDGVAIAIIPEEEDDSNSWDVFIINTKDKDLKNVLVTSDGYGEIENQKRKTSTLRWFFEILPTQSYAVVEPILEEVFGLTNEYWVSYYVDDVMYDRKFVFLPESIQQANLVNIPVINKKGILIK
ncbi:MAG: hypothetical protein K0S33_1038 [Bacteroidetes bacterium]|jgi:hypothetical protein|nr:hypothetical protein [Bacteroidota bacterium]